MSSTVFGLDFSLKNQEPGIFSFEVFTGRNNLEFSINSMVF